MTVVNRLLGRKADEEYIAGNPYRVAGFPDVTSRYWAYWEIMEAANSHAAALADTEIWSEFPNDLPFGRSLHTPALLSTHIAGAFDLDTTERKEGEKARGIAVPIPVIGTASAARRNGSRSEKSFDG